MPDSEEMVLPENVLLEMDAVQDPIFNDARFSITALRSDDPVRRQVEEELLKLALTMATAKLKKPIALVVEDDDLAAGVLRRHLEAEGYAVVRSINGEDGLLEAPRHTLALITLDLQMYSMSGWQFLKQLRESGMQSQVPVIIVSGRPVENDLAESRGAAAVLRKPVLSVELKAALAKLGLPMARGAIAG